MESKATVIRAGQKQKVSSTDLVPGDLLLFMVKRRSFAMLCKNCREVKYANRKSTRVSQRGANESKEILEVVRKTRSNLLVMGAYSRNRMSQLIFGGVTEFVIRRTTIPVFMLHT